MGSTSITRRITAWIACMAILFAALMPSLSKAMQSPRDLALGEICTTSSVKLKGGSVPVSDPAHHLQHCPFCSVQDAPVLFLPSAPQSITVIDLPARHPFLFFQSPRPLQVWLSARSRAPPAQA